MNTICHFKDLNNCFLFFGFTKDKIKSPTLGFSLCINSTRIWEPFQICEIFCSQNGQFSDVGCIYFPKSTKAKQDKKSPKRFKRSNFFPGQFFVFSKMSHLELDFHKRSRFLTTLIKYRSENNLRIDFSSCSFICLHSPPLTPIHILGPTFIILFSFFICNCLYFFISCYPKFFTHLVKVFSTDFSPQTQFYCNNRLIVYLQFDEAFFSRHRLFETTSRHSLFFSSSFPTSVKQTPLPSAFNFYIHL